MECIETVRNLTIYHDLNDSVDWYEEINLPFNANGCIVRSINAVVDSADPGMYLIWSDINSPGYLGSFAVAGGSTDHQFNSNPQTMFQLKNGIANEIHLRIMASKTAVATSFSSPSHLVIELSLIKYKC